MSLAQKRIEDAVTEVMTRSSMCRESERSLLLDNAQDNQKK